MVANASGGAPATTSSAGELQTLIVVSAAHLVSHLHIMVLPVLLPLLKERMNVGFFELGLALTTFNIVSGLTQAPMGFLVDRIGARRVLIAGLLLGGAAFLSLAMSGSYGWLFVVAVLAGLANCVYHPADYAILTDSIPENRVGRAFSVHTFAGFVGSAIAPPLLLGLAAVAGLNSSVVAAGLVAWAIAALVFLIPDQQQGAQGAAGARPTLPGLPSAFLRRRYSGSRFSSRCSRCRTAPCTASPSWPCSPAMA